MNYFLSHIIYTQIGIFSLYNITLSTYNVFLIKAGCITVIIIRKLQEEKYKQKQLRFRKIWSNMVEKREIYRSI